MSAPDLGRFIAGFRRFQKSWFCRDHNLFENLVEEQSPKALVIACSDSRVDPALLLDCNPGDLFVVRNVANLVPPYEAHTTTQHGVSAALEFAVRSLKVEDIIILGHARCGGIKTLLSGAAGIKDNTEFLSRWVSIAAPAQERVQESCPHCSEQELHRACEQESILVSLENLMTFPWLRERVERGELSLHGWFFDLEKGELLGWDAATKTFQPMVRECI